MNLRTRLLRHFQEHTLKYLTELYESADDLLDLPSPRRRARGTVRDDEFMADLSRVVNGTAPADYLDPARSSPRATLRVE
jgi:hypothetical protein